MMIMKITYKEKDYPVRIQKKKIRRIIIKVNQIEGIFISCPLSCSKEMAMRYLEEHRSWLEKILSEQLQLRKIMRIDDVLNSKLIYLQGKTYDLIFNENLDSPYQIHNSFIEYQEDFPLFLERIRKDHYYLIKDEFERCKTSFQKHIRQNPYLVISKMKTRWGSCNYKTGRIAINKIMIHLPKELLHYLMLHEFAHLLYPNHSRDFHAFLNKCLPDYRSFEKRLKNYTFLLHLK